jgi:hypothetical protein
LRAAALRAPGDRRRAALFACRDSDCLDAALRPSRFSAPLTARARFVERRAPRPAARVADSALRLVVRFADAGGGGSSTPARRAFERPIAIACFVERAPCLPSRT